MARRFFSNYKKNSDKISLQQRKVLSAIMRCRTASGKGVRTQLPKRPEGCCAQLSPDPVSDAQQASGRASALRKNRPSTTIFKTRIKPCRWNVRAEDRSFLPERTSQRRCDLRPNVFRRQNHVAGDHGTAFCFSLCRPADGSPCGNLENPFRQKGPSAPVKAIE